MQFVSSRENPAVKLCAALMKSRKERGEKGLFVTEGYKTASEAQKAGYAAESAFFTQNALDRHGFFIKELASAGAKEYLITQSVADKLSDAATAQGLFCVWKMPVRPDGEYLPGEGSRIMILCSLQDPGNVGAVIRSCEALGIDALVLSPDCPDLYSPKLLRSAAGGVFRLPAYISADMALSVRRLKASGVRVYASSLDEGGVSPRDMDMSGSVAVMVGNEGSGLPGDLIALADGIVTIPMAGGAESLNAACAASIIAWELYMGR